MDAKGVGGFPYLVTPDYLLDSDGNVITDSDGNPIEAN